MGRPALRKSIAICTVIALAVLAGPPTGPQIFTFHSTVDDSDQPYALYLPDDYSPAREYPLVVSLHAEDSNHRINLRQVFGQTPARQVDADHPRLPNVPYIVACPLARGTMGYQGIPEKDVYDVLADVERRFRVDEDRVYLTGISMGGGGALWLGLTRPDVWAAIAAVAPVAPPQTRDRAVNALNLPIRLFHGSGDTITPPTASRAWQHDLLAAGTPVEYTEYAAARHNAWELAFRDGAIFNWFGQFRRSRFPDRVRFVTDCYRYNSAYWVQIDELTPGVMASIDVRFTEADQLSVETSNLDAFTLKLAGHPKHAAGRFVALTIDGVKKRPSRALSWSRTKRGWQPIRYVPAAGTKRAGLEGPISEAFSSGPVFVYGQREKAIAQAASEWQSDALPRLALTFPVRSDETVPPQGALILFGTRETNRQIARLDAILPLALNVSAADYGLVFIYPVAGRIALIDSGLPWWTGGDLAHRGLPFVPNKLADLFAFPDFVLFRGGIDHVIAEGRFTRDWKFLPEDAAKLRSSGAVEIR